MGRDIERIKICKILVDVQCGVIDQIAVVFDHSSRSMQYVGIKYRECTSFGIDGDMRDVWNVHILNGLCIGMKFQQFFQKHPIVIARWKWRDHHKMHLCRML